MSKRSEEDEPHLPRDWWGLFVWKESILQLL